MATTENTAEDAAPVAPKLKRISDAYYMEIVEKAARLNTKLQIDRKFRLPFIDSHTGVAQNNCYLWNNKINRMPGKEPTQLYTYPAKRWKKRKRAFLSYTPVMSRGNPEINEADLPTISSLDASLIAASVQADDEMIQEKAQWYEDLEAFSEPPDVGDLDERMSDISDYEAEMKKKKKGRGRGRKKKEDKEPGEKEEKPFACELCGARYKTRPGLTYHYTHFHNGLAEPEADPVAPSPKPSTSLPADNEKAEKQASASYCDFCLGDAVENKNTNKPEELVSCSDCGRAGHPSCLQFTQNMIISVKKYPWQCIECKSCGLCGTSDNDDQLLFCDDCDRGYHMYCLKPPLSEPPEGSWSCHLCIDEFHGGKKPSSS
ncbi:zinc finger protein ubi-d4-like isoform X2 [Lineus longissimus]|uniref:zinc finger protein ubi-d4-like isoform X2 n=1 Tax=Lineus longissimus TaxID=88925 RepID=UPI002B4DF6C2